MRAWLEVEDPRHELKPGMFCTAKLRVPAAQMEWQERAWTEDWRNAVLADLLGHELFVPGQASVSGIEPLLRLATRRAMLQQGLVPAIPESAVVDSGSRKLVFVERMPGTFDAVPVAVGRRCGEFYPMLRGVEVGDRIVSSGAFLLDAASRLDPSIAASYFGAGRSASDQPPPRHQAPEKQSPPAGSADDKALAAKQKICPVTDEPLDSMGGPVKVVVAGKTVFICCPGCEKALRKNPEKYLRKLETP
jgi:YHS domain-containing protein